MNKNNTIDHLLDHIEGFVRRFHVAFPDVPIDEFLRRITYWRESPGLTAACARVGRAAVADMRGIVTELQALAGAANKPL